MQYELGRNSVEQIKNVQQKRQILLVIYAKFRLILPVTVVLEGILTLTQETFI